MLGSKGADAVAKAHEEARALLAKLDSRLDPLFSFHYAPPPAKREVTIRTEARPPSRSRRLPPPSPLPDLSRTPPPFQAPAVSLEEKVPTALAASSTLAPEEVYGRKRSDKALADRAELSQGERKALRSKKKRVHKRRTAESAEQRTLRAEAQPGGAAARRQEADRVGEQLAEAKRRGTITSGPLSSGKQRGRSSSKAFFSSMQAASQAPGGLAGSKRQRVADARKAAQGAGAADGASFKL